MPYQIKIALSSLLLLLCVLLLAAAIIVLAYQAHVKHLSFIKTIEALTADREKQVAEMEAAISENPFHHQLNRNLTGLESLSGNPDCGTIIREGLLCAIEWKVMNVQKTGAYEVELETTGTPFRLRQTEELMIYGMFEEALNNVIRHANATAITIWLNYAPHHFECCIADNGVGFGGYKENSTAGSGLYYMRKRAQLLDASLKINSHPMSGTLIRIYLPIPKHN